MPGLGSLRPRLWLDWAETRLTGRWYAHANTAESGKRFQPGRGDTSNETEFGAEEKGFRFGGAATTIWAMGQRAAGVGKRRTVAVGIG